MLSNLPSAFRRRAADRRSGNEELLDIERQFSVIQDRIVAAYESHMAAAAASIGPDLQQAWALARRIEAMGLDAGDIGMTSYFMDITEQLTPELSR